MLALLALGLLLTTGAQAQSTHQVPPGSQGPLAREPLLERLQQHQPVQDVIIAGDDLLAALAVIDQRIELSRCVIEGGLRLPPVVQARLALRACLIEPAPAFIRGPWAGLALYAHGVRFEREVDFSDTHFAGPADFTGAQFAQEVRFNGVEFTEGARFTAVRFAGEVSFLGKARLGPGSDFTATDFQATARFANATFLGPIQFLAHFHGPVSFRNAHFQGTAHFAGNGGRAHFEESAIFANATFEEDAGFQGAVFEGRAHFGDSAFQADADFSDSSFRAAVDFEDARVAGVLALKRSAHSGAHANFRHVQLGGLDFNSVERLSIVSARFDMRGATIGNAHFEDIIFERLVDLSDTTFGAAASGTAGITVMRFVTFEAPVFLSRGQFEGPVVLEHVKFHDRADFTAARFLPMAGEHKRFALSYVDVAALQLRWSQLPSPRVWWQSDEERIPTPFGAHTIPQQVEPPTQVLKRLEDHFRERGELTDANRTYYHRKRIALQEARHHGPIGKRLGREVEWWLWGLTAGYGTRLEWILAWALLVDLGFALLYWRGARIHREPHPTAEREHSFRLRLLDLPKQYLTGQPTRITRAPLVDALRISSVILFKVGYRDTALSGKVGGIPVRRLVRVEWALGYAVVAALLVTLANTQPLINQLLTGLF
jgi:uncharacterized protein YjbI with pentapeptide repeats